jgi:RNA polymerase primary sigma factor
MEDIYMNLDMDCSSSFMDIVTVRTGINATTLCTLARDADAALKRLVDCNMKLVLGVVSRYRSADIPNSELIAEGSRGLARAAERYDFQKGFRFATYATWYVHQAIASYIKARQHLAKMPTVYAQMRRRIKVITDDYHNETGNSPCVKYLSRTLRRSPFDVIKVLSMNKYPTLLSSAQSNDRWSGKHKNENRERTREESLQSHSQQPNVRTAERNSEQCMRDLLHLCLTAEERGILQSRLGISDGRIKPFKEVGNEFDISWRQVRSVEKTALCTLKESADVSAFAESYQSA